MYALYARQSRDKKDSISIESQFDFCMKEVPEGEEVKKYKDKGFSGKNIDRPDFQKLLKDIEKGNIEKVIVYRLDRMSRSTLDFAKLMEKFKQFNVDFISTTEKFDTSTPIGKAMLSIIMVFAELERETIQQRITDNYYQRGKKAMHLGGITPIGFDLIDLKVDKYNTSAYSPNKDIEIVKYVFDRYANTDDSLRSIATKLNEDGRKVKVDWTNNKARRMLKNPAYVKADVDIYNYFKSQGCIIHNDIEDFTGTNGMYIYGKGDKHQDLEGINVVIAPHEGIIESKTWLKCQYRLKENKQIKNKFKSKYTWLSGLTKCGKCSAAMCTTRGTTKYYFRCVKKVNSKTCDMKYIPVNDVELNVEKQLFLYMKKFDNRLKVEKIEESNNEHKILIASKEQEINNLIDKLISASEISMKYINERLEKLDNELMELRKKVTNNYKEDIKIIDYDLLEKTWGDMEVSDKREIAKSIISKIHIHENDIKIEWKY